MKKVTDNRASGFLSFFILNLLIFCATLGLILGAMSGSFLMSYL